MNLWSLLVDIGLLIGAAIVLGAVCIRLKLSPLVGYLVAGMVLGGPGSLGLVGATHDVDVIAELGVSLLLFGLGLEFSFARIRAFGRAPLLAAGLQVTLTPLVALPIAVAVGLDLPAAVVVALMVTLSSTASVLRVLADRSELGSLQGRNAIAVLLAQDLAVIPFVIIVSLLGGAGGDPLDALLRTLGGFAAMTAALWVLLNLVAARLLATFSLEQNREMSVLFAVGTGIGAAVLAHEVGISPAMGAFVAGMMLGSSPFAVQIRADVTGLRIVLLTLFFGAAGMVADPVWIVQNLPLVLGITLALIVIKTLVVTLLFRATGQTFRLSLASAITLAQVGEFAFVLGAEGADAGVLGPGARQLMVSVVIMSLILAPLLIGQATRLSRLLSRGPRTDPDATTARPADRIFVFGFGPAGRHVVRRLLAAGRRDITVVDLNGQSITRAREMGVHGEIGDIQQVDALEHHGVREACLVVITTPGSEATALAIAHVRQLSPGARIVVRSHYKAHRERYEALGAHAVAVDEVAVGERLGDEALANLQPRENA
ncbi:cation:proton antiporter [bacterium]|nr:cation:proton antiporter [bacterium]